MTGAVLLLGAGASIDAGVPSTNALTKAVYDDLRMRHFEEARIYAFVLGKLITYRSRIGINPFDAVGIEDLYATLKRFLGRHRDVLGEFVHSWDDFGLQEDFDAAKFHEHLSGFLKASLNRDHRASLASRGPGAYLRRTLGHRPSDVEAESHLRPFIESLVRCLQPTGGRHLYVTKLVQACVKSASLVATLNYDLVFEDECDAQGIKVDYGISQWNDKKVVRFHGQGLKLAKLHGSTSWYESGDDIIVHSGPRPLRRSMIFGGQSEKLVSEGPFLQLRHEFQVALRKTNKLGIIGYSFGDVHLNSLIRTWASTRRSAKMVVLDPATSVDGFAGLGPWTSQKSDTTRLSVDVVHMRGTAGNSIDNFFDELYSEPLSDLAGRNFLGMRLVPAL